MPAPNLHRALGNARCVLARPQAAPVHVRMPQFSSTLCFSPKTQACNHPQPCPQPFSIAQFLVNRLGNPKHVKSRNVPKSIIFPPHGGFHCKVQSAMAYTLAESYLYACSKVRYARNRSRTACFNEGFLRG